MRTPRFGLLALLALLASTGCSSRGGLSPGEALPPPGAPQATLPTGTRIKHVFIIVQENRTVDNIFAGYPGAETSMSGKMRNAAGTVVTVKLHAGTFMGPDIVHGWIDAILDWDAGKMDGFYKFGGQEGETYPYAYLKRSLVAPYWAMARQYVLADHMFPTMFGPSFTAHLTLVASTVNLLPDESEINLPSGTPWGCDAAPGTTTSTVNSKRVPSYGTGPFPCFTQFSTIADTLDEKHVSWRFYAPQIDPTKAYLWGPFASVRSVRYGPDWKNVIYPETTVLTDAADGKLPSVAWITPDEKDSDHAGSNSNTGPSWVAAVVNAIGKSKDWKSSAIFVVWDDWGGWYDNVSPPQVDFRGLGIRVPCMIISPYVKKGVVSKTQYEFGSIVKFVEQTFGLPTLGSLGVGYDYTDARANSLLDVFDFTQKPRAFKPIPAPYPASYFLKRPPSYLPPDDE